jgi:uncharacterized protein YndB with AHSA1/START domain
MARTTEAEQLTLTVRRTFAVPPTRVYQAWTEPAEIRRWAAPGDLTVPLAEADVRVGGSFRQHMVAPNGMEHRVTGRYVEVDPPHRLQYTWRWENRPDEPETLVTVEFIARGDGTELVLTHARFQSDASKDSHEAGWNGCLAKLAGIL